jgi:hypothetical protein
MFWGFIKQDSVGGHLVVRKIKGRGVKFDMYFIPGITNMQKRQLLMQE